MAGGQTNRLLIIGSSGSGKSTLAEAVVERYATLGRYRYLVVLTKDAPEHSRLSEFCHAVAELDDKAAGAGIDWRRAIEAAGSLFLEVTALDARDALAGIGRAVIELGDVLLVVDEAQQVVDRNAPPDFLQLWTRGRKHGVSIVTITQSLKIGPTYGLNVVCRREATALVTFHKSDTEELKQLRELLQSAELAERVPTLRTPRDGGRPEYIVRDLTTGRALLVSREGEVDMSAGAPAADAALNA